LELIEKTQPVKFERSYRPYTLAKKKEINFGETDSLFFVGAIKKFDNRYYIISQTDHRIHVYNNELHYVHSIGDGQGRGPGEIEYLVDYDIQNNNLWAVDTRQLAIHRFNLISKEYIESFYVKGHPLRVVALENNVTVMTMGNGTDSLFTSYSLENREKRMFGKIVEGQIKNFLALDGKLEKYDKGFIYIPRHASLVYIYDNSPNLKKIVQTPDGQYFPSVKRTSTADGNMYQAPESPFTAAASDVDGKSLYVMVFNKNTTQKGETVTKINIDKYDLDKGTYLYSYKMDEIFHEFIFDERELCLLLTREHLACYHVVEN